MLVLRRTEKLAPLLPESARTAPESDTALGDWYVNRLVVDRKPLLLLVSARSLLPILIPARDARKLPDRLPNLVAKRLARLGFPPPWIEAELAVMTPVVTAKTANRSVVGIMVDFAYAIPFYLDHGAWDETTLPFVEAKLTHTPCHMKHRGSEVIWPDRAAMQPLAQR